MDKVVRIVRDVRIVRGVRGVRAATTRVVVRGFSRALVAVLVMLMGACSSDGPQGDPVDLLVNKVWRIMSPGRAPGSFYAFLSNGTLIMTSCVETYRLATWRAETPTRLEITEDTAVSYTADVLMLDETRANLRLNLKSEQVDLELATSQVPFVCPDLPR